MPRSFDRLPTLGTAWAFGQLVLIVPLACGTDAVGVDACRDVEYARCEAAEHCGLIEDVSDCRRFYHDHCLHGVRLEEPPGSVAVRNCVEAIRAAGECAEEEGPRTAPAQCGSRALRSAAASRVCDVVSEPERAPACAFLNVEPMDDDEDSDASDATDAEDAGKDGGS